MRSAQPDNDVAAKQRMIDAATALFAEKGIDGASMRALTSAAAVNLAAVNYHFGSKEGLTETVFEALALRVNKERIAQIDAAVAEAGQSRRKLQLERLISIFAAPYLGPDAGREGLLLARLILMHRLTPSPMTVRIIRKHFDPMAGKFVEAYKLACPNLDEAEYYWRYSFMVGTVVLTVTDQGKQNRVSNLTKGVVTAIDRESLQAAMVRYVAAGLRAA